MVFPHGALDPRRNSALIIATTLAIAASTVVGLLPATARADVITTYTLSGVTTEDGGTVTGSFEVDQTTFNEHNNTGYVSGSSTLVVSSDGDFDGTYNTFSEFTGDSAIFNDGAGGGGLAIVIGEPPIESGSISDFGEGLTYNPNENVSLVDGINAGVTLASTPAAVPEPGSLALLGTALAGYGAIRRRRKRV